MIVRTQEIRFRPDRQAYPPKIKIGFEGDNMVERLCFRLPRIAENQTATMMLDGEYANMVILTEDEDRYYVDLTTELIGGDGEHEAYVVIDGGDTGEAWGSGTFTLQVGEIPGFAGDVAERFPDAIEQLRGEIAGHRAEMQETSEEIKAEAGAARDDAEAAQKAANDAIESSGDAKSWARIAEAEASDAERHAKRAEQYRGDIYEVLKGGDDGQVLGIVDGEPTWIDPPEVGNGDVSMDALAAAIARHNASGGAHPDIRAMIGASGGGTGGSSGVHVGSDEPQGDQNVWIDPEGEANGWLDESLTQAGRAADAKATGDKINKLSEEIEGIKESGGATSEQIETAVKNYLDENPVGEKPHIYNVMDFGAVGDGVTDDGASIDAAFAAAIADLPAEVYFPRGEYGLLTGGILVKLPLGAGGLTVRGEGSDKSKLKYLENWTNGGKWYSLSIGPVSTPTNIEEYLHDISILDMGVYDTDPIDHAWHVDKGDPATEETHGFDIQYTRRATVARCEIRNVGDEAIDIYSCVEVLVTDNKVYDSPAAGANGGAISICDGSDTVVVSNNVVNGSIQTKINYGIVVESLLIPVRNVIFADNIIENINSNGINISCPNEGATAENVLIDSIIIKNCVNGVVFGGIYPKNYVAMSNIIIDTVSNRGFMLESNTMKGISIKGCTIKNTGSHGIFVSTNSDDDVMLISDCLLENIQEQAMLIDSNCKINNCYINGAGLKGGITSGAIQKFGGELSVSNCKLANIAMSKGLQDVAYITNTDIFFTAGDGDAITGGSLKSVLGGSTNGRITVGPNGGIIDGVTIESNSNAYHGILLSGAKKTVVSNCRITLANYDAVCEIGESDYNIITGIISNKGVNKTGANSISSNNIRITT